MESKVGAAKMIFPEEQTEASRRKVSFSADPSAEMDHLSFGLSLFSCSKGILENTNKGKGIKYNEHILVFGSICRRHTGGHRAEFLLPSILMKPH